MDKMKMSSPNLTVEHIEKIAEMFPNVMTEAKDEQGNLVRKIDFAKLKQELSTEVLDGDESYDFTWVGKKQAMVEANKPINKTLRPCLDESVNWDTTENLYIEGDNLEVLKLLQESYLNKVKMIYIDPPYNTGNDSFIYPDDYAENKDKYDLEVGAIDASGYRMFKNNETNGRFHSSWCSMMYPRLKLARNLLTNDGVIFISIDDNEVENMKKICSEVFGENNFIAQVVWERAFSPVNLMKHFSPAHDYLIVFAKDLEAVVCNGIPRSDEANDRYDNPDNDPRGVWSSSDISVGPAIAANIYPITTPSGRIVEPPAGRSWRLSQKAFCERLQDNRIWFGPNGDGVPRIKRFLSELRKTGITPTTVWSFKEVGHSQGATQALQKMFDGKKLFDYPKPVDLIHRCISLYSHKDSIVLDFFSGSATTAHAVMSLNAEDGGKRKFIMVQLPEVCDEKSEAYKAGYKNICEIGKERIRRAGKKIVEDTGKADLDIGFKVLKLDSSNMKDVYYTPDELSQTDLIESISNIKDGRSGYDLLYQCLLDWGLELSLPHKTIKINNNEVHIVNDGDLIACFDANVSEDTIKQIADKKPMRVVFRDSSFATPAARINVDEIFKLKSPQTDIKVL
jgi:adenine-specific DNA-methyltransferase